MGIGYTLKLLLRSRSWSFARNYQRSTRLGTLAAYAYKGRPFHYRPGTMDPEYIHYVLLKPGRKADYWLPDEVSPRVILDIGANIGCAAVFFANRYPGAEVHSFEPVRENHELLAMNTAPYPRIHAHHYALGGEDGGAEIRTDSARNYGGFSIKIADGHDAHAESIEVRHAGNALAKLGITRVDLIKIDTEGAEYDILTSMPEEMICGVQWIIGELHGVRDFELLHYLSRWFTIGLNKGVGQSVYLFNARNRRAARQSPGPVV